MAIQITAFEVHQATDPSKQLITDGEKLERFVRFLAAQRTVIIDYETSGVDWYKHARPVGLAAGAWDEQGRLWAGYAPWAHITGEQQLDQETVTRAFAPILQNEAITKAAHNIKFEDHFTRLLGLQILGPRYDTMVAGRLYDEDNFMGLEVRVRDDLGSPHWNYWPQLVNQQLREYAKRRKMLITKYKNQFGYSELPIGLCASYAGTDIHDCGGLLSFYERWGLSSRYTRIWPTEMELTRILCDMERAGLPLDREYIEGLQKILFPKKEEIEGRMKQLLGQWYVDPSSDDSVRYLLTQVLRLPLTDRTKKKQISIEYDAIVRFKDAHAYVPMLLEWREVEKLLSTYTQSLINRCDANGVLHCDFQQVGTNTGRLSSKAPNFQNFPTDDDARAKAHSGKKVEDGGVDPWSIKRAFLVPKGKVRLCADYSQIELRMIAHYSQDPIMVDNYIKGGDIHERTQKEVGDLAKKEIPRRVAKVINFGLSFGLTSKGLSKQANISEGEAQFFLDTFLSRYTGFTKWREQFWHQIALTPDQSFRNLFGRERRLPTIVSDKEWERGRAQRQATATLIQGTAAELMKETIVRVDRFLREEKLPAQLVNTIHDEMQIDAEDGCQTQVVRGAKRLAEAYPEFSPIPIITEVEYTTTNWAEKQEWKEAA